MIMVNDNGWDWLDNLGGPFHVWILHCHLCVLRSLIKWNFQAKIYRGHLIFDDVPFPFANSNMQMSMYMQAMCHCSHLTINSSNRNQANSRPSRYQTSSVSHLTANMSSESQWNLSLKRLAIKWKIPMLCYLAYNFCVSAKQLNGFQFNWSNEQCPLLCCPLCLPLWPRLLLAFNFYNAWHIMCVLGIKAMNCLNGSKNNSNNNNFLLGMWNI